MYNFRYSVFTLTFCFHSTLSSPSSTIFLIFSTKLQPLLSKKNVIGGACSTHAKVRNAYNILVGKPAEMRPYGRCRSRGEDYIKTHLGETGGARIAEWYNAELRTG
jgi:hypothetical protein